MKFHQIVSVIVAVGVWAGAAPAADVAPAKTSLGLAISPANRPAKSVECNVTVGPTSPIVALAFSPDGKTLASAGYQEVLLWDLAGAKLSKRLAAAGYVGAVAWLKDGKTLAVGQGTPWEKGSVQLIDIASGNTAGTIGEFKDVVNCLSISPDGKLLAAGAAKAGQVWTIEQKKVVATISGHNGRILSLSFSLNGKFLVSGSDDNTAQVWNVADWSVISKFNEIFAVRGSAFHPDDVQVLLAIGNSDGAGLRFRKTDTPTYRRQINMGVAMPMGLAGPIKSGRVFVPASDKSIRVYDIKNGSQLAILTGHLDWVYSVAVSADETKLASGSADGTVRIWNAQDGRPLATLAQLAPRADQWLMLTAQGHLATSTPAALSWKIEKLTMPLDQVTAALQSPELVAKTIAGDKVPPPVLK